MLLVTKVEAKNMDFQMLPFVVFILSKGSRVIRSKYGW